MSHRFHRLFAVFALFAVPGIAQAQTASDPITLTVDAASAPQKILHAHLTIPVRPGPLVLYYPKWIPGEHMPDGPIMNLAGLRISAHGQRISWRRDLIDMFTFHLTVPQGANSIDVNLDFLLASPASGFSAGASATSQLAVINWNQLLLYPAGNPVREIYFAPALQLPKGWKFGTALPGAHEEDGKIEFAPVPLNTLVDSPVLAGGHFRVIDLSPGKTPSHQMDIAADSAAALAMPAATEEDYKNLVEETGALFGVRHYRDYHFLLTLSDNVAHFGLEHHESSDDRVSENTLIDPNERVVEAGLLPHEFTHSWNGKYRRPADLATSDYQEPMQDDLLWVYEGLTEYLGNVLTTRSGLWTPEEYREYLAFVLAGLQAHNGRIWRPLQDTADAAQLLYNAPEEWSSWRRGVDYYDEGNLLWLAVDTTLRTKSHDRVSMNDFCRKFYGGPGGEPALKTYTFDDVVATLNSLVPYDWAGMLQGILTSLNPNPPMEGVQAGGWELSWNTKPNTFEMASESVHHTLDLDASLGMLVDADGTIRDVVLGHPAYNAGIGPDMKIVAVNGRQYSLDNLRDAVHDSRTATAPIVFVIANGAYVHSVKIDYHDGLSYPHLVRMQSHPDLLDQILTPMVKH